MSSSQNVYVGDGTTTTFSYTFDLPSYSAIVVNLNDVALTTGYSINTTLNTVVFDTAPSAGAAIRIVRSTSDGVTNKFGSGAAFIGAALDENFEQILYRFDEVIGSIDYNYTKSLRVPASESSIDTLPGVTSRANKLLGFDASGAPTVVAPSSQDATDVALALATTQANLRIVQTRIAKESGYTLIGDFSTGFTITVADQCALDLTTGEIYRWDGPLPKTVSADSTLEGTGGESSTTWVRIDNYSLRSILGSATGAYFIGECASFDALRTTVPPAEGAKIHLRGYHAGSLLGGGTFIGHLGTATDNGVTIATSGGGYYWVREEIYNIDVFMAGAYGDGVTDDWNAIQTAINYVNTLALVAGAVTGAVILPFGYTYKVAQQIYLDIPIKFHCLGNLHWAGTGYCIRVARGVGWNVRYDIYIRNAWADNTLNFPTTWINGGTGLLLLTSITFSRIQIDTASGFTEAIIYGWADGTVGYTTVVQHNTFILGQMVNSGRGIRLTSLDAASSSAQANRFFIQNIYQNYDNIVLEGTATNSNVFWINAMDNCRNVGIDLYGHLNEFHCGFAGAPGVALRENATYGNSVQFGNSVPTDLTIAYGPTADNHIRCANPGPSYLPASRTPVSGTAYQNTYGVPLQIFTAVNASSTAVIDVYIGKNGGALSVIQQFIVPAGQMIPITFTVQPGWYWKLFTESGSVTYSGTREFGA